MWGPAARRASAPCHQPKRGAPPGRIPLCLTGRTQTGDLPSMFEAVLPFPNIDPVLFRIGPLAIRWYALAYIAGLLLGWSYILRLLKNKALWVGPPFKGKAPATPDNIGDLFVWITIGVILG